MVSISALSVSVNATSGNTTTDLPTISHISRWLILVLHKSSMKELLYEIALETQQKILLKADPP